MSKYIKRSINGALSFAQPGELLIDVFGVVREVVSITIDHAFVKHVGDTNGSALKTLRSYTGYVLVDKAPEPVVTTMFQNYYGAAYNNPTFKTLECANRDSREGWPNRKACFEITSTDGVVTGVELVKFAESAAWGTPKAPKAPPAPSVGPYYPN